MTKQYVVDLSVINLKKSFSTFLAKFGKTPPDMVAISMEDGEMNIYGSIPGTQVLVGVPEALTGDNSGVKTVVTLSLENAKTFSNVKGECKATIDEAGIEVKSGRTVLRLPQEVGLKIPPMPEIQHTLSTPFANFLDYALPILKKTTSILARSETHLECCTDAYKGFAVMSFVGSKIHIIETAATSDLSVYDGSEEGTTLVIPFDLLEGLSDVEQAPMIEMNGNSIVLKTNNATTITQTREHSLGVGYEVVSKKVKVPDDGATIFKFNADKLHEVLQSLPSIPNNGDYDFKLKLEEGKLSVFYGAKGVKFDGSVKAVVQGGLEEPIEFALEVKELASVIAALADTGSSVIGSVMKARVMFRVKSAMDYNHFVAMSRVA